MGSDRMWLGLACLVAAFALAIGAAMMIGARSPSPGAAPRPSAGGAPQASTTVLRYGDCGVYRLDRAEPVVCSDPRADVQVGARRALGDPKVMCPLYDRDAVLATSGDVGSLYICWVPVGGGPSRTGASSELVEVTTTEPEFLVGVCGDVHDQHVHAPMECGDARVDAVVTATAVEPERCPADTLLAVPASTGRAVCWGSR